MTQHSNLSPEQRKRLYEPFHALTSIAGWADSTDIRWFGDTAYVCTAGMFYYFGRHPQEGYKFIMSCTQDLGELR